MGGESKPMRSKRILAVATALIGGLAACVGSGQEPGNRLEEAARDFARRQIENSLRSMNRPFPPFRIIGNLYYVGASDVASYLIATPDGLILINSGFEDTVPMIRDGVRKLGFRFEEIKVLLNSHAHIDHAGGHALLKKLTGAQIVMSRADAELLANGGKGDFLPVREDMVDYPPARADRIIGDGDLVALGGVTLTARLTPGHTKGCTTWTMVVEEAGKTYHVVIYGSTTLLPGVRLLDNPMYPAMAEDFAKTFRVLKSLPCDVFLGPHGTQFGLGEKARRLKAGEMPNPFIDPGGYRAFLARSEEVFLRQRDRERRGAASRRPSGSP
jgi:metallo-beta-lactamase class B